jgi:hypothetical protein
MSVLKRRPRKASVSTNHLQQHMNNVLALRSALSRLAATARRYKDHAKLAVSQGAGLGGPDPGAAGFDFSLSDDDFESARREIPEGH